ncbi:hypothetical protein ACFS2C_20010 [Prauserella oleivorans]|uniref:Uncharacterized protein n=1 Tax=Prauserella oleivorans TaxID=1478153 RepID=A0ABW5WDX5_9PSEU
MAFQRVSTSPCSAPSMGSGHSAVAVPTRRSPHFSSPRRDRVFTAIAVATTRSAPSSVNASSTRARPPSVA